MSELYGDQLNDGVSIGVGDRISTVQNRLTDWRLQIGLGAADAVVNLKNSIFTNTVKNTPKTSGVVTNAVNNVRSFQRNSLPIKNLQEFNSEVVKINKNTGLLEKIFLRFSKDGLKNINGLDDKGLKPLNETIIKSQGNFNKLFRESDSWIGKLRKNLNGIETAFEKIAGFTFGVTSVKILTDSFISLRNEVEKVSSAIKILNKTGFSPELIESVNKFEDALLNLDTGNVEELATSFVSQYKSITSQLAQIGTLTQEQIKNSAEKGEDFLGDYFDKVQNMVETSLKSTVTSSDALEATYTALQAGLQEKGGMSTVDTAVENSLKLVATQGGDANAVMELLVQTMTAFNLSAASTGDVLGKLNKLVDIGITSIPELQQGFGQLGVSASSAGVTLDEMAGTLAQLTLSGSNTFMAMTGLNNLFNKIRSGSVTDRLAEMGATLDGQAVRFDSSSVAAKGFTKSLDELNRALGGNKELIQQAFGGDQEAVRAALGALKTDVDTLDKLIKEIGKAGVKNLEDAFNIKINNDQVLQFEQILNRVSEVALKLGKILAPLFSKGIDRIEKNIDRIGYLVKNYGDLILKLVELNLQLKAVNAIFGVLISTIFKLIGAYGLYFIASGKLQKNLGIIWNALTKKNEAIAKGNILWDKQANLLTKAGALIGQLIGVYDLERKGKEQITKEEQKGIEKTLESRAVKAAAHKETLEQLRAEQEEYRRLQKIKDNPYAVGDKKLQRVFQERDEQKEELKDIETRQQVFEIEARGRESIQQELQSLESKQVRTDLEEKKLELLRNVQQRDNNIVQLEREVDNLKQLKKEGKGGLVADKALTEREADLRRLKEEREFDNFAVTERRKVAEEKIQRGSKAEQRLNQIDRVVNADGETRREVLIRRREEIAKQEFESKKEQEKQRERLKRIDSKIAEDREITSSRNANQLDDRNVQLRRYTTDRTLSYIDQNENKPSFQRSVERERRRQERGDAAGNFGQDLASGISSVGTAIGGRTGSALNSASNFLYNVSGAGFLVSSASQFRESFAKTGDSIADGASATKKTIESTFKLVTGGVVNLAKFLAKLITPTNLLIGALTALGATIVKLGLDSENSKNQAQKLLKDTETTPTEEPKSAFDRAKENLTDNVGAFGKNLFDGMKERALNAIVPGKNLADAINMLPGGKRVTSFIGDKVEDFGEFLGNKSEKPRGKVSNFFNEKLINPLKNYFNFGERINANEKTARSDVLSGIFKEYGGNLGEIEKTTRDIQTRNFDDVMIGDKKQSFDYTKTISTIFGKSEVTNDDVNIANKVKQKVTDNLQTKLNAQNESLQLVNKKATGLLTDAITETGLKDEQKTKLEEITSKIIDEKARIEEKRDEIQTKFNNKEISEKDFNEQNKALDIAKNKIDDKTSDIFTESDKTFFRDTYNQLGESAKRTLETAVQENVLLKERTRLYQQEKKVFDSFQEAANATQSFIKNLADVGGSNTPEAKAAEMGLQSKINNLGNEVSNFVRVMNPKEGDVINTADAARAGKIFENLQNNLPGIIEGIVGNAQSGFSDDTNKAQRLRDVIKTQVTDKFVAGGFSQEEAERKTNALLKQYGIQQQIRELEQDDFQKRMERLEKEKQVFEVLKQSELLVTKDIIQKTQQYETRALEETISFQQKKVEDLRTKVKSKDKKDGYDPKLLTDAENELKVLEQKLIIQRIEQKRELLQYETKVITDEYEKRYAEIEEKVLLGEKQTNEFDRIDLEANKQQEILRLNAQTQMKLREMLEKEGKLTKETRLRIEKEIQQARVELLRSYVDEAMRKYDVLAQRIQRNNELETQGISAVISKLGVKSEIYDKINAIVEQQNSVFQTGQNSLERDANYLRENLRNRRAQIKFEKDYFEQRKKALVEQLGFERESLNIQKEQNRLLLERLRREQEIREKTAKVGVEKAVINLKKAEASGDNFAVYDAQKELEIAELDYETAIINRENIKLEEARIRNENKIKEYEFKVKEQQSFEDLERDRAKSTRTRIDDNALVRKGLKRFETGDYILPPELDKPSVNTEARENDAQAEIVKIKENLGVLTQPITKELKNNRENIDKTLTTSFNKLSDFAKEYKILTEKLIKNQDELVNSQVKNFTDLTNNLTKTQNELYRTHTKEIQGQFLEFLNNLPQKPTNKTKSTENITIEKVINNTMREMLNLSGINLDDLSEKILPKIKFSNKLEKNAGGLYNFDDNTLEIDEKYKESIENLDEEGMRILVHELRHWMQDEKLNKGWLNPTNIKDSEKRSWVEKEGIPFSGNNKEEKDAYAYDAENTSKIIDKLTRNIKTSMSTMTEKDINKQTTLQEKLVKYVEKLYDTKTTKLTDTVSKKASVDRMVALQKEEEEYPGGKPNADWTKEQYYDYQKWVRERNPHLTMTFADPEAFGITKSKNSLPELLGTINRENPNIKYENILSSLKTKENVVDKLNSESTTNNNNSKNVNVSLAPRIEITIEKDADKDLAQNTAQEINKQLFTIFNEVAYKI